MKVSYRKTQLETTREFDTYSTRVLPHDLLPHPPGNNADGLKIAFGRAFVGALEGASWPPPKLMVLDLGSKYHAKHPIDESTMPGVLFVRTRRR